MCSVTHFAGKEFIALANAKLHISIMMITAVILNTIIAKVSITFVFTRFSKLSINLFIYESGPIEEKIEDVLSI
jgi:hypothetical protein